MTRIPFSQVLKSATIDLRREYDRLYAMFFVQKIQVDQNRNCSLRDYCAENFIRIPFRGTCVSLDDFDDFYDYNFEKAPKRLDVDYLVSFCEYTYNMVIHNQGIGASGYGFMDAFSMSQPLQFYIQQVLAVIEAIGYMPNIQGGITDFVPKDQAAIAVSEIIDPNLSYKVIEYNHHSMKGDINRKKSILLALEDKLEPQKSKLKEINATFERDLFNLFNNLDLRHNNTDPNGKYYIPLVAAMKAEELEVWYDDTYQMCLLAFLELDHLERKSRIKEFMRKISGKTE